MLELLGVLYAPMKDLYTYYKGKGEWPEKDKLVDIDWPDKSGFKVEMLKQGWTVGFTRPDKLESRKLDGAQVMYEIDKEKSVVYRLVLRDGLVLIGWKEPT